MLLERSGFLWNGAETGGGLSFETRKSVEKIEPIVTERFGGRQAKIRFEPDGVMR